VEDEEDTLSRLLEPVEPGAGVGGVEDDDLASLVRERVVDEPAPPLVGIAPAAEPTVAGADDEDVGAARVEPRTVPGVEVVLLVDQPQASVGVDHHVKERYRHPAVDGPPVPGLGDAVGPMAEHVHPEQDRSGRARRQEPPAEPPVLAEVEAEAERRERRGGPAEDDRDMGELRQERRIPEEGEAQDHEEEPERRRVPEIGIHGISRPKSGKVATDSRPIASCKKARSMMNGVRTRRALYNTRCSRGEWMPRGSSRSAGWAPGVRAGLGLLGWFM